MNSQKLIAGMDEAGRGPAIGPMVFGLAIVTEEQENELKRKGIKDSKALTAKKRTKLATIIKKIATITDTFTISARQIDDQRTDGTNLNQIEVNCFKQLIRPFVTKIHTLQLDAADVNEERFGLQFKDIFNGEILSKHKGDSLFTAVSAASIIAKVERDRRITELQKNANQFDSDLPKFGSGYPSDAKPFIESYLKKYNKLPDYVRKTWSTSKKLINKYDNQQRSLDDW